jgi:hypothetical protein
MFVAYVMIRSCFYIHAFVLESRNAGEPIAPACHMVELRKRSIAGEPFAPGFHMLPTGEPFAPAYPKYALSY